MSFIDGLFSLKSRHALVTGGTRGIGAAIAIGLAKSGATITLIQRNDADTTTRDNIRENGGIANIEICDLADNEQVKKVVGKVVDRTQHIDILVNCGGIQRRCDAEDFPEDYWDEVLQVNLKTVFLLARDVGKHMLSSDRSGRGNGKIINIASLVTYQGGLRVPAYTAAKHGVAGITKSFSNEWSSKGINVNAIAPGYIFTDMNDALINDPVRSKQILERIPAGRWGKPEDFVGSIIYLASSASDYVSGETLLVDGGWMAR